MFPKIKKMWPSIQFTPVGEDCVAWKKLENAAITVHQGEIERPHQVIGIIETEMGKDKFRLELD